MAGRTDKKAQGAEAQALCEQLGVSKLWRNSQGEYFTELTYALASEGGDKKKISLYEAEANAKAGPSVEENPKENGAKETAAVDESKSKEQ